MKPFTEGYSLEPGPFGLRAVLTSSWTREIQQSLLQQPIADLELNGAKGWRGQDLSFLSEFPELLAFKIIGTTAKSLSPIHLLHNLRSLDVLAYCKTELRFGEFPFLVKCGLEWRRGAESLFECVGLRNLFVNRFGGSNTDLFGKLKNLESLAILGSPIKSLEGLRFLRKLRSLRLGALRVLATLKGIENLIQLEKLEINTCRKISSVEEIATLINLHELYLDNIGNVPSLKSLAPLHQLRRLTFVESTNIVDGDLSALLCLPNLETIAFQNRKHYSHRREDFGKVHRT
jgi:Leucine-rich repeat (LRR) protein